MPLRCPVCKADTATATCRRCKADLTMLFTLEEDRAALLRRARRLLASGRAAEAAEAARHANGLREDEESLKVVAMASLLLGDHHEAWRVYRRVRRRQGR
jgi:hypothetical protein